jgi:hypothetical protein
MAMESASLTMYHQVHVATLTFANRLAIMLQQSKAISISHQQPDRQGLPSLRPM